MYSQVYSHEYWLTSTASYTLTGYSSKNALSLLVLSSHSTCGLCAQNLHKRRVGEEALDKRLAELCLSIRIRGRLMLNSFIRRRLGESSSLRSMYVLVGPSARCGRDIHDRHVIYGFAVSDSYPPAQLRWTLSPCRFDFSRRVFVALISRVGQIYSMMRMCGVAFY
jgi:hypothetical protein